MTACIHFYMRNGKQKKKKKKKVDSHPALPQRDLTELILTSMAKRVNCSVKPVRIAKQPKKENVEKENRNGQRWRMMLNLLVPSSAMSFGDGDSPKEPDIIVSGFEIDIYFPAGEFEIC